MKMDSITQNLLKRLSLFGEEFPKQFKTMKNVIVITNSVMFALLVISTIALIFVRKSAIFQ